MGLSRNKVAVPEGAAGTPPFWSPEEGFLIWFRQVTYFSQNVLKYKHFFSEEMYGGLAQLARALAWHARGHRFDPDILHLSGITHFIVCIISAEIFDILTHKTVVLDIYNNQEHSRKYETSVIRLNRF